jgi:hypothetical protein
MFLLEVFSLSIIIFVEHNRKRLEKWINLNSSKKNSVSIPSVAKQARKEYCKNKEIENNR